MQTSVTGIKKIAVLDGGGVRGKFTHGICTLLAFNTSDGKLSKVFDLIVGVSVGSWIAALIGLGMMDLKESSKTELKSNNILFSQINDVFRNENEFGLLANPKYDGVGKHELLHRVFHRKQMKDMLTKVAIVCLRLQGKVEIFQSWNPKHQDLFIADILDASSAVPVYFPVVEIPNFGYYADGGIRANTPLNHSWLQADELWPTSTLRILSIGTQNICEIDIDEDFKDFVKHMGLFAWLAFGIFDVISGAADDSEIKMMRRILGLHNFLRIYCDCGSMRLDDISLEAEARMQNSIKNTWSKDGANLLRFCGIK